MASSLKYQLYTTFPNVSSAEIGCTNTSYSTARGSSSGTGYNTDINGMFIKNSFNSPNYTVTRLFFYFANPLNIKNPAELILNIKYVNYSGSTKEFYVVGTNTTLDGTISLGDFSNVSYVLYSDLITLVNTTDTVLQISLNAAAKSAINGGAFSFVIVDKGDYDNTTPTTNTGGNYFYINWVEGSNLECKYRKTSKINGVTLNNISKITSKTIATALIENNVLTKDVVVPTTPSTLSSPAQSTTTIDLVWNATPSYDLFGVYGYRIYWDAGATYVDVGATTLSHQVTGLSPATSYEFYVVAHDEAGNESSQSNHVVTNTTLFTTSWSYLTDHPGSSGPATITVNSSTVVNTTTNNDSGTFYVYDGDYIEISVIGGNDPNTYIYVDTVLEDSSYPAVYAFNAYGDHVILMEGTG